MKKIEEQVSDLLNSALKAAKILKEHLQEEKFINVVSHMDADGLTAAGIIGKALARLEGSFRIRIERWLDERVVKELASEHDSLIIFTDMGSGYLDLLKESLSKNTLIILDHHQPIGETSSTFFQVNPHLHGVDGSRDLSGAGVAYFFAKALDKANIDLAYLAVVGALGDLQDKYPERKLGGVNKRIVEDAVKSGYLKPETDLLFFGRETRPIHIALARTTTPFIPGLSGEVDKSLDFITSLKIKLKKGGKWRALRDLSKEEKQRIYSQICLNLAEQNFPSDVALNLIGSVYTLIREDPWTQLRDAREFASLLNATGRMGKQGIGVALCLGDRDEPLRQAEETLGEYRRTIARYMNWLTEKPERIQEMSHVYVVRGEDFIDEKVISAIASIQSMNMPKTEKPVLAFSLVPEEGVAKISARAPRFQAGGKLNLGEILSTASEKFHGRGGGHDIAAGAQVPTKNIESFLKVVNELVRNRLEI